LKQGTRREVRQARGLIAVVRDTVEGLTKEAVLKRVVRGADKAVERALVVPHEDGRELVVLALTAPERVDTP